MLVSRWRNRLVIAGIVSALLLVTGWLARGPVLVWIHRREAEASLARRAFPAARGQLEQCLRLAPDDADCLIRAAQAARRDGDLPAASRFLARATAANADRTAVRMERWLGRLQSGDLREARTAYDLCLDKPNLPDADLVLEALLVGSLRAMHLSLARSCIKLWTQRERDIPGRVQGLLWQGEETIRRGDHAGAMADYRAALELDPASDQARRHLAEILVRTDPREAMEHLELLRRKRPEDQGLRLLVATCRRNLGDHEDARRLLDGLLAESPEAVPVLLERGQVELDLRRTTEAERWFRRAEQLAPNQREPNLALARCLQVAGQDKEARKYRQRVEQIDAALQKQIDTLFTPSSK